MQFTIIQLKRRLYDGLVMTVHWVATKKDGFVPFDHPDIHGEKGTYNYTASAYGSIDLPAKDPSDPTFLAYEDITEVQAIQWALDAMGTEQVEELKANLNSQIEEQKNPTQASGVPWTNEFENEQ